MEKETREQTEERILLKLSDWLEKGITTSYLATTELHHLLEVATSVETKAWAYLTLGQITESRNQYDAAIEYYTRGLTFRTTEKGVKYLLHNNTAYCLNVQGLHRAAEGYCRLAIDIDPQRHNAYKNLGVSLAGQKKIIEAAKAYIQAARTYPSDVRALYLLQELIKDHADVMSGFPEIVQQVEQCKELAATVQRKSVSADATHEICRLKYVPEQGFVHFKDGMETEISADEIVGIYGDKALWQVRQFPAKWVDIVGLDKSQMTEAPLDLKDLSMTLVVPQDEQGEEKKEEDNLSPEEIAKRETLRAREEGQEAKTVRRTFAHLLASVLVYIVVGILRLLPRRLQGSFLFKWEYFRLNDAVRRADPELYRMIAARRRERRLNRAADLATMLIWLFCLVGLLVWLLNSGVNWYRAWSNTEGMVVEGYGLYQKETTNPTRVRFLNGLTGLS